MKDSAPPQGTTAQDSATDADLWRLALTDDPGAFGVILDRHFLAIHRFCARRTGSADRADDLVSIVFLEGTASCLSKERCCRGSMPSLGIRWPTALAASSVTARSCPPYPKLWSQTLPRR